MCLCPARRRWDLRIHKPKTWFSAPRSLGSRPPQAPLSSGSPGEAPGTFHTQTLSGGNATVLGCFQAHQVQGVTPEVGDGGRVVDAEPGWGPPPPSSPGLPNVVGGQAGHSVVMVGQVSGAGGLSLDVPEVQDFIPPGGIQGSWLDVY